MIDVEPIVAAELERLLPFPEVAPDWADVERRSGRRPLVRQPYLAAAAAIALAAVSAAVLALSLGGNGPPSIVDRAYAAISGRSGVMHFLVTYGGTAPTPAFYEEYWFDLAHPSRERIVQTLNGHVHRQLVYVGSYRRVFSQSGKNHNPVTIVTHAPPPTPGDIPSFQGVNPILGYRQLLRSGRMLSQTEITYRGRAAYKLVILREQGPPNLVYASERITYIVDQRSYYPLEYRVADRAYGEFPRMVVIHFLRFEILPATPRSEALLRAAAKPEPYKPRG